MSSPPLPHGLPDIAANQIANRLHSQAIHLLRSVRVADRATGLSPERLSLLSVLTYAGPKTASSLAEIEEVSRPAITRIIKSLVALGFVTSETVPEDRRQTLLRITEAGREVVDTGRKRRLELIAGALQSLNKAQLEALESHSKILETLDFRKSADQDEY